MSENRFKSGVLRQHLQFNPKCHAEVVDLHQLFSHGGQCKVEKANECVTTLSLTVSTQRHFVVAFVEANAILYRKGILRFLGSVGATYDAYLRLIIQRLGNYC